ncbi:hypothetical protein BH09BAC4_BH09BAC4_31160 [soil metagenome]
MKNPKIITEPEEIRETKTGGKHRLMLLAKDTDGDIYIEDVVGKPGGGVELHMHSLEDELFFIHKGEIIFTIGTDTHVVSAGAIVYAPLGVPHGIKFTGTEDAHFTTFVIPGRNFEAFVDATSKIDAHADPQLKKDIAIKHGITTY